MISPIVKLRKNISLIWVSVINLHGNLSDNMVENNKKQQQQQQGQRQQQQQQQRCSMKQQCTCGDPRLMMNSNGSSVGGCTTINTQLKSHAVHAFPSNTTITNYNNNNRHHTNNIDTMHAMNSEIGSTDDSSAIDDLFLT